ncbi:DUF1844 domain-containing protein [bacterium]|nr:DUF1844 domain-containing protein [bacterium]
MSEEEGGFKVKDRRRFDDSGNLRAESAEAEPQERPKAAPSSAATTEGTAAKDAAHDATTNEAEEFSPQGAEEGIDYSSFILSLATQAMVQLGEMPPPPGVEIPKNVEAARHTIDVIEMLDKKTVGNLNDAEKKLTSEILHSLRLAFVNNK